MPDDEYPPFAGAFRVTVDLVPIGRFSEVSGLEVTLEVDEFREGGDNSGARLSPKHLTWPRLRFKRGVTRSNEMLEWFLATSEQAGATGQAAGSALAIELHDPEGVPVRAWAVTGAIPTRWVGPTLAANSTDVAVEELEVAHEGFRVG